MALKFAEKQEPREFVVRWTIEVTARTAKEAAQLAAEAQRDPKTLAIVFEVAHSDQPNLLWTTVEVPWSEVPDSEVSDYLFDEERETEIE